MKIYAPQISGSLAINGTSIGNFNNLVSTSSFNQYTSSISTGSLATTGSNTFVGNQTMSGSIIPAVTNTYDLGDVTHQFRHLYLSSGSLYINGTKVLGASGQELQITTDNGQSLKILEAGSDTITLQSADGNITLATSGGGDVILDPTSGIIALKGTTTLYAGNKILSSDGGAIQVGNDLGITGSLVTTGNINGINLTTFSSSIASTLLNQNTATSSYETKGSGIVSGSSQITPLLPTGTISGSSQITYTSISSIPSGIVSGSSQTIANLPTGTVSGSSQILGGSGLVSGSSQVTYTSVSSIPSGIVSGAAQVTTLLPTGVISGSSQLNNASIENLTVINLTTINETASVIFSSGSNRFGDFGNDIHDFTGSVQITGSFTLVGSSTATSYNGTINATNGVVSGSSQTINYLNSAAPGVVSGSSQTVANLPTGTVSGSSQIVSILSSLNTYTGSNDTTNTAQSARLTTIESVTGSYETKGIGIVSGSSQITYTGISSIPGGIVSGSSQITYASVSSIPAGIVSGSSQVTMASTTGFGTYINQAVLTTSSPTFAGVTLTSTLNLPNAALISLNNEPNTWGAAFRTTASTTNLGASLKNIVYCGGGSTEGFTVTGTGTGTAAFEVRNDGRAWIKENLTVAGTITESSSIRYKENIETIKYGLDKVLQMRGVTYDKKDNGVKEVGVIAEEVYNVLPEVVLKNEEGEIDSVSYGRIVGVLIEAIKEQQKQIEELKSLIK